MHILAPVVEIPTLTMFHPRQNLTLRGAVALELIRDNDAWHVLQPLEQLAKKLLRCLFVASTLYEDVQDVVVLINRAPQVMALAINGQKDFIQMPLVARSRPSILQLELSAPFKTGQK